MGKTMTMTGRPVIPQSQLVPRVALRKSHLFPLEPFIHRHRHVESNGLVGQRNAFSNHRLIHTNSSQIPSDSNHIIPKQHHGLFSSSSHSYTTTIH
jgi:hypothetical protein